MYNHVVRIYVNSKQWWDLVGVGPGKIQVPLRNRISIGRITWYIMPALSLSDFIIKNTKKFVDPRVGFAAPSGSVNPLPGSAPGTLTPEI